MLEGQGISRSRREMMVHIGKGTEEAGGKGKDRKGSEESGEDTRVDSPTQL